MKKPIILTIIALSILAIIIAFCVINTSALATDIACFHTLTEERYTPNALSTDNPQPTHERYTICLGCNYILERETIRCLSSDGVTCVQCNSSMTRKIDCAHSGDYQYYSYVPKDGNQHAIRSYCSYCGIQDFGDPLNGQRVPCVYVDGTCTYCGRVCAHTTFNDGVCKTCGYTCPHRECNNGKCLLCGKNNVHLKVITFEIDYGNNTYHYQVTTCDSGKCGFENRIEQAHSYNQDVTSSAYGTCSACGWACEHSFTDNTTCDYCGATCINHIYNNGFCVKCHVECSHQWKDKAHTYISRYYHDITQECTICGHDQVKRETHPYNKGYCSKCKYTCDHLKHDIGSLGCQYCDHKCTITQTSYGTFKCSSCDYLWTKYEKPNIYEDSLIFRPNKLFTYNANVSFTLEDTGKDNPLPFLRATIAKFDTKYDYNGSVHLLEDSSDYTKCLKVDRVDSPKYLVMRIRHKDITHLQVALYGGLDDITITNTNSQITTFHWYPIEDTTPNEWITLVFDLSEIAQFKAESSTYKVGQPLEYIYFVSCARYGSNDGFIDYDYIAFVNRFTEIDRVVNARGYTNNDYHYIVTHSSTFSERNVHYYANSTKCYYCGADCAHSHGVITEEITDKYGCGARDTCLYCKQLIKDTVTLHTFKEGNESNVCTKCGTTCNHTYSKGICIRCSYHCTHVYNGTTASCLVCHYIGDMPSENDDTLAFDLISAIYDCQLNTFLALTNYNIFGINLAMVIGGLIVLAVTFFITKKFIR